MPQANGEDSPLLRAVQRYLLAYKTAAPIANLDQPTEIQHEFHQACLIEAERALEEIAACPITTPEDIRIMIAFAVHLAHAADDLPAHTFAVIVCKLCEALQRFSGTTH
jgi:hypothetical protein